MPISLDPGTGGRTTSVDWSSIYTSGYGEPTGAAINVMAMRRSNATTNLINESKTTAKVGAFFELYDPFWALLMEGLS